MARTEAPPAAPVAAPPAPPPAAPAVERQSPVLAWPSEWPVPVLPEQPARRSRAGRGLPMAPVLAAGGNATAMTATAAYQLGGPIAVAATGAVAVAGATAAMVRRRATVRRSVTQRSGRATATWGSATGGGGAWRGATAGGSRRSGGGGGSSGGGRGAGSGKLGSAMAPSANRPRGGSGSGSGGGPSSKGNGRHEAPGKTNRPGRPDSDGGKRNDRATHGASGKSHGIRAALGRAMRDAARPDSTTRKALRATGRGAKAAWNTTARSAATRAVGRHAKRLGGAAWDGLRSVLAGARTWLRKRDGKAALARIRDAWKRRRSARNAPPATPTPTSVAATVRRPTATTTTTSTGGTAMSGGHHFVAPAMEGARLAANYDPKGMMQVGQDFAGLEEGLLLHAEGMKVTVDNADAKFPLDPRIVEIMRQIHGLQLKAADLAKELQPAFRKLHDVDITRIENPRKGVQGERMWDVAANL